MQTCYEYSCKWRYTLNPQKTVVLVFGETISQHKRLHLKRGWKLGTDSVGEKSEHKHVGITLSSILKNSEKVRAACLKMRSIATLFSIVESGLRLECTIVHFKRLGSRVFHDSFNQCVSFFSKQCTHHKTNAIYT